MSGHQKQDSGFKGFTKEVAEHAVMHVVGHVVAGTTGSLIAAVGHFGTLNEHEFDVKPPVDHRPPHEKYDMRWEAAPQPK